jgi:arylsulfatase
VPENQEGCKRPNILIFLVDDMGWGDFGPYGGGIAVGNASPNINKLAASGLLLTSTYAQPTCSPTRATIHTGQLPVHHGVLSPPMYGDPGGIGGSITLPELLRQAGYYTQGVGKWHLGENEESQPQNVGYDDYYGFLSVSDMYTEWRDPYFNPEVRWDAERTNYMNNVEFSHYVFHGQRDTDGTSCQNLREIVIPEQAGSHAETRGVGAANCTSTPLTEERLDIANLDQEWIRYSERFIRERAGSSQPWFLYHATRGCHFDNYPNHRHQGASYARTVYSDCAVEIDEMLGRLILALEETGQDQDTFVFFTSDNGPEDEIPPHGRTPFRGGKGDTWEGGVRVPGIAWWPGMIEAGRRSDGLFDLADLFTTSLAFAGVDVEYAIRMWQDDRYIYGIDQTSFLLAGDGESNRRSVLYWFMKQFAAVRMDEFKAHRVVTLPVGLDQGNIGGCSGVTLTQSYQWLFNLHQDPQEENNVFVRHLWNKPLFSNEFQRFETVLKSYPPNFH